MDNNDSKINWIAKYETIKKRFQELKKLRTENIKYDIISLNAQLKNARDIHEVAINELKQQNIESLNKNLENEQMQQKIESLIKLKFLFLKVSKSF